MRRNKQSGISTAGPLALPSLLVLALLALILASCGGSSGETAASAGDQAAATEQFFAMDTLMGITVYGADQAQAASAAAAARAEIDRLELLLSRTDPDSQLSRFNQAAGSGEMVPLDIGLLWLLDFSRQLSLELGAYFDVTIAPLMDAWGFGGQRQQVPSPEQLAAALPLVNSQELTLDLEQGLARLNQSGMGVDLGAVAKGFAAGQAEAALRGAGSSSALLDLGGNITAVGRKPDGQPWQVAVRDPADGSRFLGVLALTDLTASTSGGYERYFEQDGRRYHHLLDPASGYPADSGLLSATVIAADPLLADALSTALFVAGEQEALACQGQRQDFELILCTEDGRVILSAGLAESFRFTGEEQGYDLTVAWE